MTEDNSGTIAVPNVVKDFIGGLPLPGLPIPIPLSALGQLASVAEGLFGRSDDAPLAPAPPYPGTTPGAAPYPGMPWEGKGAEAEEAAKVALAAKTKELKDLDAKLTQLSEKIVDDNNEAKKKLQALQTEIEKELKYAETDDDSSVVKSAAVNKFMQDKSAEIAQVITDAGLAAADSKGKVGDLTEQYGVPAPGAPGAAVPGAPMPADPYGGGATYGGGMGDTGMYGEEPYYDDGYYDEGDDGGMADTMSKLADTAAGAMPDMGSMMPGMGSMMPPGLGDLGGIIGSALKSAEQKPEDETDEKKDEAKPEAPAEPAPEKTPPEGTTPETKDDGTEKKDGTEEVGAKADQPGPPPPPAPTLVVRPDGSNVTASSPAAAAAARAVLGGAPLEDAYKAANIGLPHPGSPLKDTIELGQTEIGDLAQFKDRYVMMMGDRQVYLDGQMQPASALAKLSGFVGFRHAPADPSAGLTSVSTPAAAPAATPATAVSSPGIAPTIE